MHIKDVLIDDLNGAAVVPGHIEISGSSSATALLPAHEMVELHFGTKGLDCKPVTALEKLPTGFCKIVTSEPCVRFFRIKPEIFNSVLAGGQTSGRIAHAESSTNAVLISRGLRFPDIAGFDLRQEKTAAGLRFTIRGEFAASKETFSGADHAESVSIAGVVPWPTLMVKGHHSLGAHKFVGQGKFVRAIERNEPRDPLKCDDLMIAEGLVWPYAVGRLDVYKGDRRHDAPVSDRLAVHFNRDSLGLSQESRLELLSNGFYRSMNHHKHYWLRLNVVGSSYLEEGLRGVDTVALSCEGKLLGRLGYDTGYAMEPGDPFGRITQEIAAFRFKAQLEKAGLRVTCEGRLHGFDAQEFEQHRRERNSKLVPLDRFEAEVTLPWALLQVRDFEFARRRTAF